MHVWPRPRHRWGTFPLRWDTDLGGMHTLALNQDKDAWGKDLQESVVTLSRTPKVGPRAVPSFSIGNMKQCRRCKRLGFDPWVGKILWRRKWQPTPVFFPVFCTEEPGRLRSMGSQRVRHD